jgi:hypothetical protein
MDTTTVIVLYRFLLGLLGSLSVMMCVGFLFLGREIFKVLNESTLKSSRENSRRVKLSAIFYAVTMLLTSVMYIYEAADFTRITSSMETLLSTLTVSYISELLFICSVIWTYHAAVKQKLIADRQSVANSKQLFNSTLTRSPGQSKENTRFSTTEQGAKLATMTTVQTTGTHFTVVSTKLTNEASQV